MSISKYEAASLYDFVNQNLTSEKAYLVIDLDDCSYGYCRCSGRTDINLYDSWSDENTNLWLACTETMKRMADKSYLNDLNEEMEGQLFSANEAIRNYFLSDGVLNGEAFSFSNRIITCKELDDGLAFVKEKIVKLIGHAKERISEEQLVDTNIILLGKAQELFLVRYYIQEQLSYDPLLPDERFRTTEFGDKYAEIVALGEKLFETRAALKHTYSLLAFNPESEAFETVYSVPKGQTEVSPEKIVFSKPILLGNGDKLSIKSDEAMLEISIPYSFAPSDSDLIEVAMGLQNDEDTLFIRRCRSQTRTYHVKLM